MLHLYSVSHEPNVASVEYPLGSHGNILSKQPRLLHLQVETVMLAGTLILLLMTANTLMLYSMPASKPEIVQVVVLPGILISNWTPDGETEMHCFF